MRVFVCFLLMLFFADTKAQIYLKQAKAVSFDSTAPVLVKRIGGDSTYSAFVIQIQNEVRAHHHQHHTEIIYVLSGKARMQLGDSSFIIRRKDTFVIPAGTVHSVRNLRKKPLKVLSIQTPHFDGKDRIWKEG